MMNRNRLLLVLAVFILGLCGCSTYRALVPQAAKVANKGQAQYSGPKAKMILTDLEVKSPKASSEIGAGLREMLIAALKSSNHFLIVESLPNTASPAQSADLIITVVVTEFEPQVSGGSSGMGGGGGASNAMLGGLLGASINKAHLALDIRIVDAASSEVLSSTLVQGQALEAPEKIKAGALGSWPQGQGLSGYANTPMEKAVRICIVEAARYIWQSIPATYYKY